MTSHRVPLWAAGIAAWVLVVSSMSAIDADGNRVTAWSVVGGGCVAIPLMGFDYVRRRRLWLGALIVWSTVFWFMPVMGLAGSDGNVLSGLWSAFVVLLFGAPVFAIVLLADVWMRRRRKWHIRFEDSKVVVARRRERVRRTRRTTPTAGT